MTIGPFMAKTFRNGAERRVGSHIGTSLSLTVMKWFSFGYYLSLTITKQFSCPKRKTALKQKWHIKKLSHKICARLNNTHIFIMKNDPLCRSVRKTYWKLSSQRDVGRSMCLAVIICNNDNGNRRPEVQETCPIAVFDVFFFLQVGYNATQQKSSSLLCIIIQSISTQHYVALN